MLGASTHCDEQAFCLYTVSRHYPHLQQGTVIGYFEGIVPDKYEQVYDVGVTVGVNSKNASLMPEIIIVEGLAGLCCYHRHYMKLPALDLLMTRLYSNVTRTPNYAVATPNCPTLSLLRCL